MGGIKKVRVPCPLAGESHVEKWIERREQIGIPTYQKLNQVGNFFNSDEALKEICVIFSELVLDWNLEDDKGQALPRPYQNPDALLKLAEVDSDAFLWIVAVVNQTVDTLFEPPKKES